MTTTTKEPIGDHPRDQFQCEDFGGDTEDRIASFVELFSFSDYTDKCLSFVGVFSAVAAGVVLPLLCILGTEVQDSMLQYGNISQIHGDTSTQGERPKLIHMVWDNLARMIGVTFMLLVAHPIYTISLKIASFRQTERLRVALFRSILRQDISWYDTNKTGELNTKLTDDINLVEEGIGRMFGIFVHQLSSVFTSMIAALVLGWKIALFAMAFTPVMISFGVVIVKFSEKWTKKGLKTYAKSGAIAEEVLSAISTVQVFGGQEKELSRYMKSLRQTEKYEKLVGTMNSFAIGSIHVLIYGSITMSMMYGSSLVRRQDEDYSPGTLIAILYCVHTIFKSFVVAMDALGSVHKARTVTGFFLKIMNREPLIDSSANTGLEPHVCKGNVQLNDVTFSYPARRNVQVLDGVTLKVHAGQTVALVGSSGCGKSTITQLIQRFYDPLGGAVLLDGVDIRQLNVKWLRQQIGFVSQEPVLFGTTIAENIRYGREGITREEIEQAAREANAHDLISTLPQQYETLVGDRGEHLSGGQKQRIAIARALVRNPKILLLDEATSALDTESEAVVQAALDTARKGRTTIVIAHRLSTVRSADVIVGIENGKVVEQGTHDQLMEKKGIYYDLVTNQSFVQLASDSVKTLEMAVTKGHKNFTDVSSPRVGTDKLVNDNQQKEELPKVSFKRTMRMNSPERFWMLLGALGAMLHGIDNTLFNYLLSEVHVTFVFPLSDQAKRNQGLLYYFIAVILVAPLAIILRGTFLAKSGESLTFRLRSLVFRSYLRQDMAYFDDPDNSVGALCSRLATDASAVKNTTGVMLSLNMLVLGSFGSTAIISLYSSWKLTLGCVALTPIVVILHRLKARVYQVTTKEEQQSLEGASRIAVESVENIRTVASLAIEDNFVKWYHKSIRPAYKLHKANAVKLGAVSALSEATPYAIYIWALAFSAILMDNDQLTFADMARVMCTLCMGILFVGGENRKAPDFTKAKLATARIFTLIDSTPDIDNLSDKGIKPKSQSTGAVSFEDVEFSYPTRTTVPVLQGLNLKVNPGQTLALVGSSGCGKSTVVKILERFYDPQKGLIKIDQEITSELNIQWLRSQMGLVSQEPVLFDVSIRENIAYGDNSTDVPMDEIIQSARNANIHQFISSLPNAYETVAGDKGSQLSGGQKQRIAIARALVRNPKILLLDEATSALDTESEKIVQEALEKAQQGRTCIVIAHRLSTIKNADCIAVIHKGKVVELGTHSELIEARGKYYKLNNAQLSAK